MACKQKGSAPALALAEFPGLHAMEGSGQQVLLLRRGLHDIARFAGARYIKQSLSVPQ